VATIHNGKRRQSSLYEGVSGISSVVGKKETGQLQLKFILEIKKVRNRSPKLYPNPCTSF
jgi:hypothetical protein